ncbi:MAG TPA: DNA repair protein RecN [Ignavibacteriaceae bacterium]|nr:DNA repair protein RecN [Ignavibacteriaceae bacterium]
MLKSLEIKDYALIEHLHTEFGKGLNIITGETGAGKSILIDAMSLLLGERASSEVVRKGAQKSFVEGVFDIKGNKMVNKVLEENEIEISPELIVRREISLKGSNRCFINDSPVQLQIVKEIGDLLVDLHGQHEHQSLLRVETHIDFIDEFAGNQSILDTYHSLFQELSTKKTELKKLLEKETSLKDKKDMYDFQIKEIDGINPLPDEDEKLNNALNVLENSEKLMELSEQIYNELYDAENSVVDKIGEVKQKLTQLSDIDKSVSESAAECESALLIIKEIASSIRSYRSGIDIDPVEIEKKRERLGSLNLLKKKYGGSIKNAIEHREKIGNELNLVQNFSNEISRIKTEISRLRSSAGTAAEKLSERRKKISIKVENEVKKVLARLGIAETSFKVNIENLSVHNKTDNFVVVQQKNILADEKGIDKIEFYISTNPGEDLKPLSKIASGGEVSRIMLALKSILAKSDKLPLLIFDEIDTGVSGRIAQKVGQALNELASYHQIIAITHLPQIAGLADHHFSVEKKQVNGRVVSSIQKLSDNERIREVAKLLSGEKITEESLQGAKQLMNI